jgi:hypothetical protein
MDGLITTTSRFQHGLLLLVGYLSFMAQPCNSRLAAASSLLQHTRPLQRRLPTSPRHIYSIYIYTYVCVYTFIYISLNINVIIRTSAILQLRWRVHNPSLGGPRLSFHSLLLLFIRCPKGLFFISRSLYPCYSIDCTPQCRTIIWFTFCCSTWVFKIPFL